VAGRRLVLLAKYFPPVRGGMEQHAGLLTRAVADGFDSTVIAHGEQRATVRERLYGAQIVRCGTLATVFSQPLSPAYAREMSKAEPDIVHLHAPNVLATFAALRAPRSARIVVTHHADILGREPLRSLALIAYRRVIARASAVIVSARNLARHSRDLPACGDKLHVIPFSTEPELENFLADDAIRAEAASLRTRLATPGQVLCVFVGRLVPYKGLDILLAAMAQVPSLALAVIGDGPLMAESRAQSASLGIASRVHFLGAAEERVKQAAYAAADMFAMPSVTAAEAFGISQIEAMRWGLPVVTTDLPSGVPEVGVPGETGLIVKPRDASALAMALKQLCDDETLRRRMGAAGRARALALYSFDAFRTRMQKFYAEVMA